MVLRSNLRWKYPKKKLCFFLPIPVIPSYAIPLCLTENLISRNTNIVVSFVQLHLTKLDYNFSTTSKMLLIPGCSFLHFDCNSVMCPYLQEILKTLLIFSVHLSVAKWNHHFYYLYTDTVVLYSVSHS